MSQSGRHACVPAFFRCDGRMLTPAPTRTDRFSGRPSKVRICLQHLTAVACISIIGVKSALAQSSVWGLQSNDRFSVITTIERETVIQLADSPPVTSTSKEQLELEYLVGRVRSAETEIQVRVTSFVRIGSSGNSFTDSMFDQRLKLLERVPITIRVDPNGVVTNLSGYRESLKQFAGPDRKMLQILHEAWPQQSFESWIGRPFWLTRPGGGNESRETWERIDQLSLGLMGGLRTVATCRIDSQTENSGNVLVSGTARLIEPPPSDTGASPRTVSFTEVEVTDKSFSGEGLMLLPEETKDEDSEPVQLRPWFASLTLKWSVTGKARISNSGRSRNVSFQQRQKQSSQLQPDFRMGPPAAISFPTQPPR